MEQMNFIKACEERDKPFLFVSYSHDDSAQVQALLQDLRQNHYRFWYDEGVKSGREWADEVGWRIAHCTQFLVMLSKNAVASERVIDEINFAKEHHRDFCLIFLEPLELDYGLGLQIGRKYGIQKYRYSPQEFRERFYGALKMELRGTEALQQNTGGAKQALEEHYTLQREIGRGGLADVFLAKAKRTGAAVAVKCALIDKSDSGRRVQSVMEQERRVLLHLEGCRQVPMLVDWFQDAGSVYLVEQFVPGVTLGEEQKVYSFEEITDLAAELLDILSAFAKRKTLYLDLKPNNIVRDEDGSLRLVDFGSARIPGGAVHQQITHGFSAPEQFRAVGGEIEPWTDLYALGRTILYLLLRPVLSARAFEEFSAQSHSLRYFRPDLPADLEFILELLTAERPEDRFRSPESARAALEACLVRPAGEGSALHWRSERRARQYRNFIVHKQTVPAAGSESRSGMETVMLGEYDYDLRNPQWETVSPEVCFDTLFE